MGAMRQLGWGMAIAGVLVSGCGRQVDELANPQPIIVSFSAVDGAPETATATVYDKGTVLEVNLDGQGFDPGQVYSMAPVVRSGLTGSFVRARGTAPMPLAVKPDGTAELLTTWSRRNSPTPWAGFGIFGGPPQAFDGTADVPLRLVGPLPAFAP